MKLRNGIAIAFILGIVLFIEGCKKDETKSSGSCLVQTASEGTILGQEVATYTYTNNLLTSIAVSLGGISFTETITYNSAGKPAKAVLDTLQSTYTYDSDGRLTQTVSINTKTGLAYDKDTYAYNSTGQLTEHMNYGTENDDPTLVLFTHSNYTYANTTTTNPLTITTYDDIGGYGLYYVDSYEYDAHTAPTIGYVDPGQPANNPTKQTTTDDNGTVTKTITAAYSYSSNDYPLTVTETELDSGNSTPTVTTTTYTYTCN